MVSPRTENVSKVVYFSHSAGVYRGRGIRGQQKIRYIPPQQGLPLTIDQYNLPVAVLMEGLPKDYIVLSSSSPLDRNSETYRFGISVISVVSPPTLLAVAAGTYSRNTKGLSGIRFYTTRELFEYFDATDPSRSDFEIRNALWSLTGEATGVRILIPLTKASPFQGDGAFLSPEVLKHLEATQEETSPVVQLNFDSAGKISGNICYSMPQRKSVQAVKSLEDFPVVWKNLKVLVSGLESLTE